MGMMEYKGYVGSIEFSEEDNVNYYLYFSKDTYTIYC